MTKDPKAPEQRTPEQWLAYWQSVGYQVALPELLSYHYVPYKLPKQTQRSTALQTGTQLSHWRGRGMEFEEVRHYQAGDDIRTIDWRVTARTGKPHTKVFREEKERPVTFIVDYRSHMRFGSQLLFKSVCAAHLAAALGWQACLQGDRVGAFIVTDSEPVWVRHQARQQGLFAFFHQLIEHQPQTEPQAEPVSLLLHYLSHHLKMSSDLYVISDFQYFTKEDWEQCAQLQRRHNVMACEIYDPLEEQLPHKNMNLEAFAFQRKNIIRLNRAEDREQFRQQRQAWKEQLRQFFNQYQIPHYRFSAALPLEEQLKAYQQQTQV